MYICKYTFSIHLELYKTFTYATYIDILNLQNNFEICIYIYNTCIYVVILV